MQNRPIVLAASLAIASGASLLTTPARADERAVKFGAGVIGVAGANFLGKPSDRTIALPNGTRAETDTYPGFSGFTAGLGLSADVRLLQVVGLELDLWRSSDHGHGDLTLNGRTLTIDIGQGAWHLPILLKGVLPLGLVQPMLLVGGEIVFPGAASATVTPEPPAGSTTYGATASTYALWTVGLGIELKLPLPVIDLRIPFTIRGSTRSVSDKLEDRASYQVSGNAITHIDYVSEWQWSAVATLGAALYF